MLLDLVERNLSPLQSEYAMDSFYTVKPFDCQFFNSQYTELCAPFVEEEEDEEPDTGNDNHFQDATM